MYAKINMPRGLNSGSSKSLVEYLEKEERGFFFDKNDDKATGKDVQKQIDNHVSKLGKNDDKFYMVSFSPSQFELKQMIGREVTDLKDLSYEEKIRLFSDLRSYTHNAMDIYAQNFNRDNITSGKDLLYFGRIETERTFNHYDKEVIQGSAKSGQQKEGLQFHIHVIVSRKSADGRVKLSPNIRFRGAKWERDGKEVTRGFNYKNFTENCHEAFKEQFKIEYKRNYDYTRDRSAVETYVKGKVEGKIKAKATNILTQGEFSVERKMYANSMQAINLVKTAASLSNPGTATKEVIKQIIKLSQKIHSNTKGL